MHKSTWKKGERKVCRALGGDRSTSPSQTSDGGSGADCTGVPEHVEVKHGNAAENAYRQLMELHKQAKRRDRRPLIVYEALGEGGATKFKYAAMWFEDYVRLRPSNEDLVAQRDALAWVSWPLGGLTSWLVQHEVGRIGSNVVPCGSLVEETIRQSREESAGPPLVVLLKKNSPKRVALVPHNFLRGEEP